MPPSPMLRPGVADFITLLRENPTHAVDITQAEIDSLRGAVKTSTLKTYLSWRRTAVLAEFGAGHPAYDMLRLTDAEYEALNAKYRDDVSAREEQPVRLQHTREMLLQANALLTDPVRGGSPLRLIVALALLTGRRPYELAANPETSFAAVDVVTARGRMREKFHVRFRGQAKTKSADDTQAHKVMTIPVLANATLIIEAFQRLRALIPATVGMDFDVFNRDYATRLNREARFLFGGFWPAHRKGDGGGTVEITCKDLRGIYAQVCAIVFNLTGTDLEMMPKEEYLARILGHRDSDTVTTQSYESIVVEDIKPPRGNPRQAPPAAPPRAAEPTPIRGGKQETHPPPPRKTDQSPPPTMAALSKTR